MKMALVYQSINKGANTNIIWWVMHTFLYLLSQLTKLIIQTFIFFEHVADMVHLCQQYDIFIKSEGIFVVPSD